MLKLSLSAIGIGGLKLKITETTKYSTFLVMTIYQSYYQLFVASLIYRDLEIKTCKNNWDLMVVK
ncbi:MAG: hypothetical protein Q7U47_02600 [Paludibacter sp.]|nr:hypothetical protein [Paludibacter sp.]